ncbi:hypothetical protein Tco_0958165 [Tanacetum coccineum]
MSDGPTRGLFLNVDKTELFWPVEDPRGRMEGVFSINISRPLNDVKLLGGSVRLDVGFCRDLALKRMKKIAQIIPKDNKRIIILLRIIDDVPLNKSVDPIIYKEYKEVFRRVRCSNEVNLNRICSTKKSIWTPPRAIIDSPSRSVASPQGKKTSIVLKKSNSTQESIKVNN